MKQPSEKPPAADNQQERTDRDPYSVNLVVPCGPELTIHDLNHRYAARLLNEWNSQEAKK